MSIFLDTRGNTHLSIAVCDRCKMKYAYDDLMPDPNFKGLRVCKECCDQYDPYRLPARQPEKIAIRFPRPDADISTNPDAIITSGNTQNPISPETGPTNPVNGNLNNLAP